MSVINAEAFYLRSVSPDARIREQRAFGTVELTTRR